NEQDNHLWPQPELDLLDELVSPVPDLFRDVAKQYIAAKIGQLALGQRQTEINQDIFIKGYIIGTPKRDHRFLRKKLKEKNIDVTPYEKYFTLSKDDYQKDWKIRYEAYKKHTSN